MQIENIKFYYSQITTLQTRIYYQFNNKNKFLLHK